MTGQTSQAGTTIAFIGLGNMGGPMSARLVSAGHRVNGFDPSTDARQRLQDTGGNSVDSAAAAVDGAEFVILMLPNSTVVETVLADPAVRGNLRPQTTVIDMSSSEPTSTRKLAEDLEALAISLIDAPVSGGVKGAEAGRLTIMVGGDETAVARAQPVLSHLGSTKHAGSVGAGHALKAINNLLSATHLLATAEGIAAGERFGLDPKVMVELINTSSGRSGSTDNKYPNFVLPGTFDSGFGLRLMLKDMKIAVDLAEQVGAPSRLGAQATALWEQAADDLAPTADHTEIARWAEPSN
ncbi:MULTISPECIES: NAD(P)-dependent oxidoreductase [Rhodococcus]|uniref:NAD(P)-dependent oxidoreductase n=1 Tax=Rhodococcus TaxID=1827 RepID=UPI001F0F8473|nr:NAD(P)-dependent oxidoreductase [Rhodococcus opacus]UZG52845.1 NAD(P)-dependent oxidoreductase [Rhodococcus opacus]